MGRGHRRPDPDRCSGARRLRQEAKFDYGSHAIFIGRVTSVGIHGEVDPLIYVDGKYTCLPVDATPASALQTEIEFLRQLAM